jgi:hypothetical protein
MNGMRIDDVMVRGRWAANKSARTYLQTAKALLVGASAPAAVVALGLRLALHPHAAMHAVADGRGAVARRGKLPVRQLVSTTVVAGAAPPRAPL